MASDNTAATLSANFKEIYGDSVDKVIPESAVITKEVPFSQAYKVGDKYVVPVMLSHEHGVTYMGQNPSGSGLTLNAAIAAQYQEAQVDPSGIILRSTIGYSAADKMMSTKQAFLVWSEMLVENMTSSIVKRNEIDFLYGQSGIGVSNSAGGGGSGTQTFTLTTASWSDAIWAGMEGCEVEVFNAALSLQRGTAGSTGIFVVSAVNFDNRTVTLTGTGAALDTIVATDVFYFKGAYVLSGTVHKSMVGLHKILTSTSTVFNINAGTYNLWKGTESDVGTAALTLGKIFVGVGRAVARGLQSDLLLMVNPKTFANLNSDQSALRRYAAEKVAKNGFEYLEFYSGNGKISIRSHLFCKEGDAFGIPLQYMKRIGTTDVTFKLPNADPDNVFLHVPDKAAYELRVRSEQALFCEKPAQAVYFKNIVNAA